MLRERIEELATRKTREFTRQDRDIFDEFKLALNCGQIRAAERAAGTQDRALVLDRLAPGEHRMLAALPARPGVRGPGALRAAENCHTRPLQLIQSTTRTRRFPSRCPPPSNRPGRAPRHDRDRRPGKYQDGSSGVSV